MDNVLGLLGLIAYVVTIIGVAAGVTWLVVKLFPSQEKKKQKADATAS
jgi:hypothetical protein